MAQNDRSHNLPNGRGAVNRLPYYLPDAIGLIALVTPRAEVRCVALIQTQPQTRRPDTLSAALGSLGLSSVSVELVRDELSKLHTARLAGETQRYAEIFADLDARTLNLLMTRHWIVAGIDGLTELIEYVADQVEGDRL